MLRTIIVAIGGGLALVTMAFYLCTACTDPGIVFKHTATPVRGTPAAGQGRGGSGGRSAPLVSGTRLLRLTSVQPFSRSCVEVLGYGQRLDWQGPQSSSLPGGAHGREWSATGMTH